MKHRFVALFLFAFILITPQAFALTKPYDHSLWDQFLKQYVNDEGQINYAAVQKDPVLLKKYLARIRKIKWRDLQEWPREELVALWLNAYHAGLIKNVIEHYPVKSVHEIPGFWEEDVVNVGKRLFGLGEIRANVLLGNYRDPQMHLALSYAAKSGPELSRDAFTGPTVDGQLFKASRAFVNDANRNQIIPGKKEIRISKIFQWYPKDFNTQYAVYENDRELDPHLYALLSFLAHYLEDEEKLHYLEDARYKVKYLQFDWALNDWKPAN